MARAVAKRTRKKVAARTAKQAVRKPATKTTNEKLDLFKEHKDEYAMPKKPLLVDVKPARYLAVVGRGEPGGETFQAKIGALYGVAYTIKFTSKLDHGRDYKICPSEGIWWGSGGKVDFTDEPRHRWNWKLVIRTPDFIGEAELVDARAKLHAKNKGPEVDEVCLETIGEGRCVQMLHVGPYDRESETIAPMTTWAKANGLTIHGPHHEIYLSDPRRVAPERLRTILRLPVR